LIEDATQGSSTAGVIDRSGQRDLVSVDLRDLEGRLNGRVSSI
jgi:hypothetical protein